MRASVLVHVTAVGTYGSDTRYYEHGRIGDFVAREPFVLGHEVAEVVAAHGSKVSQLSIGDRVYLEPGVPCFVCA